MTEAQRHRGPDGSGLWESAGQEVAFGHRRLAILDLSDAAAQPMVDADSGCAITFNGEIYNFREIRRELEDLGESFRSSSDTEIILKANKRWGIDSVRRFRGIFAFALWDPRSRVVHLVRDPMGIKPLYWATFLDNSNAEEVLLFASEVRALLASGAVPRQLAPAAVASYLWQGFVVGPSTIVEGVRLLPAGTILTIGPGADADQANARVMRQYWSLPSSGDPRTTPADLLVQLRDTVRMQLVSDVPLGVFLSGGVDSSAVAQLAAESGPQTLHTFTIGFDEPAYDETGYARQVASAIGCNHTGVMLTEQTFRDQLPAAFAAIDQPTFDGINSYFVSHAARRAGMTVALAGTGGDELFGGYSSFIEIPRLMRAGAWMSSGEADGLTRRVFNAGITRLARLVNGFWWRQLGITPPQTRWGKVADLVRAIPDPVALYQVFYALFSSATLEVLADPVVGEAVNRNWYGLSTDVASVWHRRVEGNEPLHGISLLELSSFIGERLLRDTDAAAMAVALEVRVPLLDHILVETVARLDRDRRFSPARKKQLLRDVALRGLDPATFDRPKSGFVLPIDTWARRSLQPQMTAVFNDMGLASRVGLRGKAIQTVWRSFVDGRPGLYWSRVWALYVLLSWCQEHDMSLATRGA